MKQETPASARRRKHLVIVGGAGRMGRRLATFFRRRGFGVTISDPAGSPRGFRAASPEDTARADVVIVAASLERSAEALRDVVLQKPRGLVFDIASVKAPLATALAEALAAGVRIASTHPMFGPEVRSFRGRDLIVCDAGDPEAVRAVRRLFAGAGLRMQTLSLKEHDAWVARSMGLAHLLALAAASTLAAEGVSLGTPARLAGLTSTSFQRLLSLLEPLLDQDAALTRAIQNGNPESAAVALRLAGELQSWRESLLEADPTLFDRKLRATRRSLGVRPR
jgi:chorismate mutase/prephenate dehydrogenase